MTTKITRFKAIVLGLSLGCLVAFGASAEGIRIRPGYAAGDEYAVSLATTTRTDFRARGDVARSLDEELEFRYSAHVVVVEIAADGSPVRERHEGVELTVVEKDGPRSLLKKGAALDVVRTADGAVQIFHGGKPVDPQLAKIVGQLLARQLEHGVAALVDPGRAVEVGETWQIEGERVQAFMRSRGIQEAKLDGPATATLEALPGGRLAVRYRIQMDGFALGELPSNTHNARSKAKLEGEVQLESVGVHRPIGHTSDLALRIKATMKKPGNTRTASWSVRRSESVVQRSETLTDQLASRS